MSETLTLEEALRDPAKAKAVWDHSRPKPKALARLGELVNLEELGLFKVQELPPSIGELRRLRKLSLGDCVTGIPDEVAALGPRLEALWLDGGLPDDVERLLWKWTGFAYERAAQ